MAPELERLDQLSCSDMPYLLMETTVFGGDRARALRVVKIMEQDGLISVSRSSLRVADWERAARARAPHNPQRATELAMLTLSLTDAGLASFHG